MRSLTLGRAALVLGALSMGLGIGACSAEKKESTEPKETASSASADGEKLNVVATTGYLSDAVKNIDPNAEITTLVKPGGDPHTQELTTKDTEAIEKADLVVWTSHDMEHKMMDQFDKLGEKQYAPGDFLDKKNDLLPWEEDGKVEGNDPHIWNSPDVWKKVVTLLSEKMGKVKPAKAEEYKANAEKYNAEIEKAKTEAKAKLDTIPKENRLLVTGHDAFNYLGKAFDMDIEATDVVSSEGDKSDKDINELAKKIADHKVKTIFLDNLKSPKAIESLKEKVKANGWDVQVSDKELYADTLAESGDAATYLGAFKHNAETIAAGLGAK